MTVYSPPIEDFAFLLHEVLRVQDSCIPGYDDLDPETTAAILGEAGRLAAEVLAPLNATGDAQGCRLEDGKVTTPRGFADAYRQLCDGGWAGLDCPPEYGGQGMPYLMNAATGEMFVAANMAFNMYLGLTHGAASTILAHGTEAQKATYLPKMVSGRWSGTMNLTEPQCGTDLGLIRTRAEPQPDGSYRITGQKIWISAGEHDLTENIVHLVLARIPGGPEGVRGISLFIVPKFLPDDQGYPGRRNGLTCAGLERKMGIHGNATCVMVYDGAIGFLMGEEHKGLRAMFTMMNEARLGVGLQGLALGAVAYQNAAAFARERLQGRAITGPANPAGPADPVIVHPDVRRNLMDQKAFVEGARAFALWGATLIDRAHRSGDAAAEELVSLLIPVLKGFLTDKGFETAVAAQQVWGGAGFTRDAGMEQFVRDARIPMIYEGTNGIQALDLVGRKLGAGGGRALMAFLDLVKDELSAHAEDPALAAGFLGPLKAASKDLQAAAMLFAEKGTARPEFALAGAYDFMHLFGHVCLGLMWTRMAAAASAGLSGGKGNPTFLTSKLATGRHYMARLLPATSLHLARIRAGEDSVMALDADAF